MKSFSIKNIANKFGALLIIPYYELIFRFSTTKDFSTASLIISLLFSLGYSALLAVFMRLSKNQKANRIITAVLLFIVPIIYLVEFFVYRSFKVFYDVNTVLGGAGGVAEGFKSDVGRLVFSFDGISRIILFMLPFLVYVIYGRKADEAQQYKRKDIIILCAVFLISTVCARAMVYSNEQYENSYAEEYNYQSVVESMGFVTGLRLDVGRLLVSGDESYDFVSIGKDNSEQAIDNDKSGTMADNTEKESISPAADDTGDVAGSQETAANGEEADINDDGGSLSEETAQAEQAQGEVTTEDTSQEPEDEPIEYGVNALDIDFNALAENASGQTKDLDLYVASLQPSKKNQYTGLFEGKNLIFFTAEAFSGYIIDPELTPTLYRLATKGIQIPDFYQPAIAGTTGGEYANLFGLLPTSGGKSMDKITAQNTWITIGNRLNDLGYYGKAFHDNKGTVYRRNKTHNRLGYSDGFMSLENGMSEYFSRSGFPQSDLEMMQGTLPTYIDKQPFNVYYMTVSGHGQYGRKINPMSAKNFGRVDNLDYSEIVKCYISNNLEFEDALTYTVDALEEAGIADDTVIVISADHFPYNLDTNASPGNMPNLSELYGYKVTNYIERDSNRLIIWSGCLEDMEPIVVDEPVFSLDILPTLCNLFGVEFESRMLPGRDIFSDKEALVFNGGYDWKTSLGTYIASKNKFTPVTPETEIPDDYIAEKKAEVRNRMNYCKGVISCNYFNHVFGSPE